MVEWWMINMHPGLPQKVVLLHRERIRRGILVMVIRNNTIPEVPGRNSRDTIETTILNNMALPVLEISNLVTVKITIHSGTATIGDTITVSKVI
jgi:hypothetical protein